MKALLRRSLYTLAILGGLLGWAFSHEVRVYLSGFWRGPGGAQEDHRVQGGSAGRIVGLRLLDPRRDLSAIALTQMRALAAAGGWVELTFDLVNRGEAHFPHLKVLLLDGADKVLRTEILSPQDYGAEGNFTVQRVRVRVQMAGLERKVAVTPYFEKGRP